MLFFFSYIHISKSSRIQAISMALHSPLESFDMLSIPRLITGSKQNPGLNITKPPWCTPTHQGLSKNSKCIRIGTMVWEISMWQIKQPKVLLLSCLIDRSHLVILFPRNFVIFCGKRNLTLFFRIFRGFF
jgi:hypothetical protein